MRYGTVSRPALATPFEIEMTRPGGFDGPVTVAVTSSYLAMWDENGLDPSPAEETATAEETLWTFEPPAGEVLAIMFDARIEPGAQSGRSGRVAVLDEDGTEIVGGRTSTPACCHDGGSMEIVIRASVVFAGLFLLTRGLRKRALSDMSVFEMLLLVTIGDIVQQGVTQEDMSITGAGLAVGTFAFWISALSWASWRSGRARRAIEGIPIVLVRDGKPVDTALALEQMPLAEVLEAARQNGVDDISKVRCAVLEVSGKISIIPT